jgi:hexosaminidase
MRHTNTVAALIGASAFIVLTLSACGPQSTQTASARDGAAPPMISIIPVPRELTVGEGSFSITDDTRVTYAAGSPGEQVATYFVELLQRTGGPALATVASGRADAKNVIHFELQPREGAVNEEGYSLVTSPGRIVVSSRAPRGLFYGAVTLWQLLTSTTADGTQLAVPTLTINDEPRFKWRGLMLDSARHYQSPQTVKRFIDVMALHKLNVLHWHLTDDQAWRLEIKKYPKLTGVGAWRVPAGPAAAADIDSATGKPRVYGGYYSQAQVREIVAYAAARQITIVPEIELPGHASAAIAAYPQLAVSLPGAKAPSQQVPADWGIYRNLFNVEDSTFSFFEAVLSEVIELFPGAYVHVGGDEAVKDQWKASPRVQARMRELGVKDESAMQGYFVQRMEKYLNAHGRRLIGWDEILEGGIAPNATVMSWRGIEGAVSAAAAGHDTVLTPEPILYFDYRPLDTADPGRGKVIDVERVYRFDPMPAALNEAQRKHVLGVQANIWTEHIRTDERLEHQTFPRAAAIAEVGWSPTENIDWASFSARLPAQLARYRALGVQYASLPAPTASSGKRRNSHQLSLCSDNLVISLEDDAPVQGQRAVFMVDIMNPCWIYQQADLSQVSAIAAAVGQLPFNFQIGDDVKKIPLRKPHSSAGELEVRLDSCDGEKIATLPLAPAAANYAVTQLPSAAIEAREGQHDLCFTFTQARVDPTWVIDTVELVGQAR